MTTEAHLELSQLALLWQIFSGTGFPNQFFSDSWVVGFWRGRPWLAGHRTGRGSSNAFSNRFWLSDLGCGCRGWGAARIGLGNSNHSRTALPCNISARRFLMTARRSAIDCPAKNSPFRTELLL